MTKSLTVMALLALVMAAAACTTGTDPTPVPTPTPGPPPAWSGTVESTFSKVDPVYPDYPPYVVKISGTVTWQRNDTPIPHGLANSVGYALASGDLTVTISGGTCGYAGQTHFTVTPWQASDDDPDQNHLEVRPDGYYVGWVEQNVSFMGTKERCLGPRDVELGAGLGLVFSGNLVGGHVQGKMVDDLFNITYTWDYSPRY